MKQWFALCVFLYSYSTYGTYGKGRNMSILQEMFACYHHCTYSNNLLRYFIKKENPVQCSEGAMKLNRAYGPLIC